MKLRLSIYLFFLVCLLLTVRSNAQFLKERLAPETFRLITDRTLYVTGEEVNFTLVIIGLDEKKNQPESTVAYAELVQPDGKKVAGGKFKLVQGISQGSLFIPAELPSGWYYLKVYTKFARNFGTASYAWTGLKIINPLKKDFLPGNNADSTKIVSHEQIKPNGLLSIQLSDSVFQTRQQVNITSHTLASDSFLLIQYSVVPAVSYTKTVLPANRIEQPEKLKFFPENNGISLTGRLVHKTTQTPVVGADINVTLIGEHDFIPSVTDTLGRFFFALPEGVGEKELLLTTVNPDSTRYDLLVDNDFCPEKAALPDPPFLLSAEERKLALELARNLQLHQAFETKPLNDSATTQVRVFYGKPNQVINFDNYVALPTLEEYLTELTTFVKIKGKGKKQRFEVLGKNREMAVFPVLVMVDMVAIDDPERILAIPPAAIDRIEIINEPYCRGDRIYSGIISLFSKKNDFAGIDLPSCGLFIRFPFFTPVENDSLSSWQTNVPDTRNTLFYKSFINPVSAGNLTTTFSTGDCLGSYLLRVTAIKKNGQSLVRELPFRVK